MIKKKILNICMYVGSFTEYILHKSHSLSTSTFVILFICSFVILE